MHNFRTKLTEWIDSLNEWIDSNIKKTSLERRIGYEDWYVSRQDWNDSNYPGEGLNRFRVSVNRFRGSHRVLWFDSKMIDTIQAWIDSEVSWIGCPKVKDFHDMIQITVNRFKQT